MHDHKILRVVSKFLIPLILVFALYVQFHGDFGPGGGFQAGVIFASAFIIHALLFGVDKTCEVAPPGVLRVIAASGCLVYGGVGVWAMLSGGQFLEYNRLADNAVAGQHLGILLVEWGVGMTVAAVVLLIFFTFAAQGEAD